MRAFNVHRTYQATFLLDHLQSHGCGATEHHVLIILAGMMGTRDNPGKLIITDSCFPSLERIALLTGFKTRTVSNAITKLVTAGCLTKSKVAGRGLRKRKGANNFYNVRYHLVPEIWDTVESRFSPEAKLKRKGVTSTLTPMPASSLEDQAIAESLGDESEDADGIPMDVTTQDDIATIRTYLEEQFPDHCSVHDPRWSAIAKDCITKCLGQAGDFETCHYAIRHALDNDATRSAVADSGKLGGYISRSFEGWLREWKKAQREDDRVVERFITNVSSDRATGFRFAKKRWPPTRLGAYLEASRMRLGSDLMDITRVDKGDALELDFEIRPQKLFEMRMSFATGRAIRADQVPIDCDHRAADVAGFAMNNEPWCSEMHNEIDPLRYLSEHLNLIGEAMDEADASEAEDSASDEGSHGDVSDDWSEE